MDINNQYIKSLLLGLVVSIVVCGYIFYSERIGGIGFPLDDAWIHQVYARNFAQSGQWAFELNNPSAGSTSLLWSAILSLGYFVNLSPFLFSFLLGGAALWVLAVMAEKIFTHIVSKRNSSFPLAGLFFVGEWHLVWAAVSGMEILLFSVCVLYTLFILLLIEKGSIRQQPIRYIIAGLVIGISILIRPEGLTLLGPALFIIIFVPSRWKDKGTNILLLLLGFICTFLPFVIINIKLSGNWMPNTYYAKQAEYASILQSPLIERIFTQVKMPMIGAGILMLPGVIYCAYRAIRERWMVGIAAILWWVGFAVLYAIRLPVAYQHGRYQIPGMVVYFLIGIIGTGQAEERLAIKQDTIMRVLRKIWLFSIGGVWAVFLGLGANAYSHDVAFINSEMIVASKWVNSYTEKDSLIACHDIGAMGYFGQRKILDLAGLVSPEVIPFINDEIRIKNYLDKMEVDYLFTFPKWYPYLVKFGDPVYKTNGKFAEELGSENMVIYRWR